MESGPLPIDTNVDNDASDPLSTEDAKNWTFYIVNTSGGKSNHVVALQIRPDNSINGYFTIAEVTGQDVGYVAGYEGSEVRLKVTTPEGAASTSDGYIFGG